MDTILFSGLVLGLTQVVKQVGLKSKYIPLFAILISIALIFAFLFITKAPMTWEALSNAIIAGLVSCGLWSGTKNTFAK